MPGSDIQYEWFIHARVSGDVVTARARRGFGGEVNDGDAAGLTAKQANQVTAGGRGNKLDMIRPKHRLSLAGRQVIGPRKLIWEQLVNHVEDRHDRRCPSTSRAKGRVVCLMN